jgi:plasmid maintenance system antidote protein VapI
MSTNANTHQGQALAEELSASGMTGTALAVALGITPEVMSDLLSGRRPLDEELANGLARVTGKPATWWLRQQGRADAEGR